MTQTITASEASACHIALKTLLTLAEPLAQGSAGQRAMADATLPLVAVFRGDDASDESSP